MNIIKLPPLKCPLCKSTSVVKEGKHILCCNCKSEIDNTKRGKGKVTPLPKNWFESDFPDDYCLEVSKKDVERHNEKELLKEFDELHKGEKEDYQTPEYFDFFNRRVA